jgi:aminomethyltransferase
MTGEVAMRTPLFREHERLHAKMVDFHGWDMPVWYSGIKEEHLATRHAAGLFDTSHMGEIFISGDASLAYLQRALTRNIAPMKHGQALYTFLLNKSGGIIDDLIAYCLEPGKGYMLCVNSSNVEKDYSWMNEQNQEGAIIENKSDDFAMIALQGPASGGILKACLDFDISGLHPFTFTVLMSHEYGELMVSRTGYTGAGGVEVFLSPAVAPPLWRAFIAAGATPCGLGARDTLRLEMGYPLHGNDITETTTPLEAELNFAVDLEKKDFIGRKALVEQLKQGIKRRLTGMEALERGVPREGCRCLKQGSVVGVVTSGSISPVTGMGIALGYVDISVEVGVEIIIDVRGKDLRARVKKPPFVSGTL